MFCIINPQGVYTYVNKTFEKRFAFMGRDFVGTNAWETILEDDHAILQDTLNKAIAHPSEPQLSVIRKVTNPQTGISPSSIWEITACLSDDGQILNFHAIGREHNVNDLQVELLHHLSDSFYIINSKFEIEEVHSPQVIDDNRNLSKLIDEPFLALIPPEFSQKATIAIQSALNGESSEIFFERKSSNEINYYHAKLSSLAFQGVRHALWIEKNITKEKKAENDIAESLSKMRVIWDSMPSLFHSINRSWEIEYANAAWEELLNLRKEDYLNRNIWEVLPTILGTRFEKLYRQVMAEGQAIMNEEYYFEPTKRWYSVDLYPSLNGVSVYTKDITDKKHLERKDEQMELKLRKVWESVIDGYLLLDREFKITYANPAWKAMFGVEGELNADAPSYSLFADLHRHAFKDILIDALKTQTVKREKVYFEHLDVWVNASIHPSEDGLTVFMQDVSNEEKMRSAMSDLSFMTSHELRHEYAKLHSVINLLSVSNEDEKFLLKEANKSLIQINSLISVMNDKLTFNRDNSSMRSKDNWMEFEEAILIDDDHVINFINARVIRLLFPGSRVKSFINAEKALNYLKEFDKLGKKLVFIDLNMPSFDGWDFLEAYRHLPVKSPVYILTSSINPKDIERSTQFSEVVKFLTKPLSSNLLESERIRPVEFK
jgi:PAS domain S-box-containing protein